MAHSFTLSARWIFPISAPPLERGTITISHDRISRVDPQGECLPDIDLGNVAILPGLVNAHTHLDLTGAAGKIPPTVALHFPDWLRDVIAYRQRRTPDEVESDVRVGLAEAMRFGTTLIGDVTAGGVSWDAIEATPIRATVYYELIGSDPERLQQAWNTSGFVSGSHWFEEDYPPDIVVRRNTPRARWAISPHAPYSVHGPTARLMFTIGEPAATHLAESPAERELLEQHTGPFAEFLNELGVFRPESLAKSWQEFVSPIPLQPEPWPRPLLIVHGNYLPADFRFRPCHTLCYCPRTHAAFRHDPHPFQTFLRRGVRTVLGTDSLASNPDLDPLAEARFVKNHYPNLSGEAILRMITLAGAEALGWDKLAGSLEAGKSADLVTIPLADVDSADPYELVLGSHAIDGPRRTLFEGRWR